MKKKVQDVYGEILRLRNEFYQKWQETSQYDDNRGAYKAKYEAFDKALELLTPSIVDPQPKESIEYNPFDDFRHTDSEEPVSEDMEDYHNMAKIGIVVGLLSIPVASMTNRFGFGQIPQLLGGIMAIGGALMAINHIIFDDK